MKTHTQIIIYHKFSTWWRSEQEPPSIPRAFDFIIISRDDYNYQFKNASTFKKTQHPDRQPCTSIAENIKSLIT